MIDVSTLLYAARDMGFRLISGVPCSYLKPLHSSISMNCELRYVGAANEGEAVGIAAGAFLAGTRSIAMFQNSGLGNAVNPIVSLCVALRIPILLIVSWRGDPLGGPDEPQHELMGAITTQLFDLMGIPWEILPSANDQIIPTLKRAVLSMDGTGFPYALLVKKGSIRSDLQNTQSDKAFAMSSKVEVYRSSSLPARQDVLSEIKRQCSGSALVASTGYIARGLYMTGDEPRQLYIVGSMGCASSVGLGLALINSSRHIIVLDGDGAALMRLGALATIGHYRPPNLTHVVLDNQMHESTGGQETVSCTADLAAIAEACGYSSVVRADSALGAGAAASKANGLTFIHVHIKPSPTIILPRPLSSPPEVAARFRDWFIQSV